MSQPHLDLGLPTLEETHTTAIPTITYVPKAARGEWTRLLVDELASLVDNPTSTTQWTRFLILARAILPARGCVKTHGNVQSQAALVKGRIRRWRAGPGVGPVVG